MMLYHLITKAVLKLSALMVITLSLCQIANATPKKREILSGPIEARVERVIDGDTLIVRAKIWLDQELTVRVRLAEIDTPELNARDQNVRRAAWNAYKALFRMTHDRKIILRNLRYGKYAGRVIAETFLADGTNISNELLRMRLAVPYGTKFKLDQTCDHEFCHTKKYINAQSLK